MYEEQNKKREIFEDDIFPVEILEDEYCEDFRPWGMDEDQYVLFMHLSQLSNFILPLAGYIIPIIMWTQFKDESDYINDHGKNIINWLISYTIFMMISAIMIFILVGIPLLIVFGFLSVLFPIIGAVKSSNGVVYKYPMAMEFFK